ncbi:MAG TPA: fibronectin type III domain-containing protein [Vicinamibacterales bacterium]|nr:fibronectin type III domain-containing protein [Vicinamibacterales bacterium]
MKLLIHPRGFAPAGTLTASLAETPKAPLRSADSLAAARSFRGVVLGSVFLVAACGKIGDPRAPLRPVPVAVTSMSIERTSAGVTVAFTVPAADTERLTPPRVDAIEMYAVTQPAAAPAPRIAELAVPSYRIARLDVRRSEDPAKGASDTRPTPGAEATLLDKPDTPASASPMVRYYAVAGMTGNRRGAPSPVVALPLSPFKTPPTSPVADYTEQTLTLKWTPSSPDDKFFVDEVDPAGAKARRVTPAPLAVAEFTTPVEIGRERCFAVRAVEAGAGVISIGPASRTTCVTPVDRFAPAAPTGPNAFPGDSGVDVLWTASTSPDVAGYIVLRGDGPDGTLRPLMTEPIAATQYRDQSVKAGATYSYQIVAVDKAVPPNRSEPSTRAVVTARLLWRLGLW